MKTFKPYTPDQIYLLPPNMADWLPAGHLAPFISDVVDPLDLKLIYASYAQKARGRVPVIPDPKEAGPDPKAQRNFTDSESRIMKDGASKGFEQAYNARIAVDEESQVIVAAGVTQETNDKKQLIPMMRKVKENTKRLPEVGINGAANDYSISGKNKIERRVRAGSPSP